MSPRRRLIRYAVAGVVKAAVINKVSVRPAVTFPVDACFMVTTVYTSSYPLIRPPRDRLMLRLPRNSGENDRKGDPKPGDVGNLLKGCYNIVYGACVCECGRASSKTYIWPGKW